MWAAGTVCNRQGSCEAEYGYALAVGIISFVICVGMSVAEISKKPMNNAHTLVSIGMVFWWFAAVLVCTFEAPFKSACGHAADGFGSPNGYFSSWISFAASFRYMTLSVPKELLQKANVGFLATGAGALLVGALIIVLQILWDSNDSGDGLTDAQNWGLSCSIISIVVTLVTMFVPQIKKMAKPISIFLALWWFLAVATLTYTYESNKNLGNFSAAGNGYFATWGAAFGALFFCMNAWYPAPETPEGEAQPEEGSLEDTTKMSEAPASPLPSDGGTVRVRGDSIAMDEPTGQDPTQVTVVV